MQGENPYSAPNSTVADYNDGGLVLADRGMRLVAAIIDTIILLLVLMPIMFMGGAFTAMMAGDTSAGFGIKWAILGFVVFLVVQGFPLNASGQTWGKKMLKMKIVDMEGRKPEFGKLIALRYLVIQLIGQIPFLGPLVGLADVLFIFGADRRCLHDKIAGTQVVVAD
jgi:uncharacterized RDD family membrane protein YckC